MNKKTVFKNLTYLSLGLALTPSLSFCMEHEQIEHLPGFPAFGDAAYRLFPNEARVAQLRQNPRHIEMVLMAKKGAAKLLFADRQLLARQQALDDLQPECAPIKTWEGVERVHPKNVAPTTSVCSHSNSEPEQLPDQQN
jgi:hypothetical protein